jgi:hypothetical protein
MNNAAERPSNDRTSFGETRVRALEPGGSVGFVAAFSVVPEMGFEVGPSLAKGVGT